MQPPTHPAPSDARAPSPRPRSRAAARAARAGSGRAAPDRELEDRLLGCIGRYLKNGEITPP